MPKQTVKVKNYTRVVDGKVQNVEQYTQQKDAARLIAHVSPHRPPVAASQGQYPQGRMFPGIHHIAQVPPEPPKPDTENIEEQLKQAVQKARDAGFTVADPTPDDVQRAVALLGANGYKVQEPKPSKEEEVSASFDRTKPINEQVQDLSDSLTKKYGVSLAMSVGHNKVLKLHVIKVPKENQNSGVGTKVMGELTDFADKNGLTMSLTPDSAFGGNKAKLINSFYPKFGFVKNQGKNKDYAVSDTMLRLPIKKEKKDGSEEDYIGSKSGAPNTGAGQTNKKIQLGQGGSGNQGSKSKEVIPLSGEEAHLDSLAPDLSSVQVEALKSYISSAHAEWNSELRQRKGNLQSWLDSSIGVSSYEEARARAAIDNSKQLDAAIEQSVTDKPLLVMRGMAAGNGFPPESLVAGAEFQDYGYVSTTTSKDVLKSFAREDVNEGGIVDVEIVIPQGSHALSVPKTLEKNSDQDLQQEAEILLPRGSKFRVVSREDTSVVRGGEKTPYFKFKLEVVSDNPTKPSEVDPRYANPGTSFDSVHQASMAPELTEDQWKAVYNYTGSEYEDWNETLREQKTKYDTWLDRVQPTPSRKRVATQISLVDEAIALTSVEKPFQVTRGVRASGGWPPDLKPGDELQDFGFVSTSSAPHVTSSFANEADAEDIALFDIVVPKGAKALSVARSYTARGDVDFMDEQEVLLPRGSRFRVVDVKESKFDPYGDGEEEYTKRRIRLELILEEALEAHKVAVEQATK